MASKLVLFIIRGYQLLVSPMVFSLGIRCRYIPSCSSYCYGAIKRHGLLRGVQLSLSRFLRCHPWSGDATFDPVPR